LYCHWSSFNAGSESESESPVLALLFALSSIVSCFVLFHAASFSFSPALFFLSGFCGKCEKGNIFIVPSAERSAIDNPQQSAALCSIDCATKDQQVRALMIGFIFIKIGSDRIGLDWIGLDMGMGMGMD